MLKRLRTWFNGRVSIRGKLILAFSLLICIPIITLGTFSYQQARESLEQQSIVTIENNLSGLVTEMDARFEREATYIKYLAYNLNFRKLLEADPVDRSALAMELNTSVEPILWYYITSDTYVKSIEIYTDRLDTGLGSFLKPASQCGDADWYALHEKNAASIWRYQDGELSVSRSILDAATVSRMIGVMRLDLFPSTFFEPLTSQDYLDNGILVLDGSGETVFARPTAENRVDEAVYAAVRNGETAAAGCILRHDVIPTTGWTVYYYVDGAMVTGQLHAILKSTLLLVGAVLFVAVAVIFLLSRTLSRRILLLKDCAERVASGDLTGAIETDDTDEIGVVINSFGTMTKRLDQTINEVYRMQLEKKAVELSALQAQINPHFLYNALSAINWKAIRQGNADISEVTGLLASFYRTSLNNGEPLTTVKNELENVRAYVELQKRMHEFEFEAEYRIDENTLALPMLNFLLQPIVENAIKHGIDYTDESGDGRIIVACAREGKFLVFRIKNNGPAMQQNSMRESLSRPGRGYGIYNIAERIDLYYGPECGLSACTDADGYTCFTVRILAACPEPPQ